MRTKEAVSDDANEHAEIGSQPQDIPTPLLVPIVVEEEEVVVQQTSSTATIWPSDEDNTMEIKYFDAVNQDPQTNPIEMFM